MTKRDFTLFLDYYRFRSVGESVHEVRNKMTERTQNVRALRMPNALYRRVLFESILYVFFFFLLFTLQSVYIKEDANNKHFRRKLKTTAVNR